MAELDRKARWLELSPLLDELLDMETAARAARLAALHDLDPALAAELQVLLARDAALAGQDFMARPAMPPTLDQPLLALPGQTLGAYTLSHEIGQGGMGSVWLARRTDGRFEGQVAIKLLASGLFGSGNAGRFAREGQILAKLSHPHIARLMDAGIGNGQPYLVLEYVDGLSIDAFCEQQRLGTGERVSLFLDVLAAVAHAHNRLILHRDLKPSNILVDRSGAVKLLDFGIAKLLDDAEDSGAATELTRQAGRAFTPQYAAPEQVQGGEVSTATDVYALGVLLYLLLSGVHPTAKADPSTTPLDRMRSIVEIEPKRLSEAARRQTDPVIAERARALRGDLDTIVAKALKKKPAERYANAEQLAADLRRWLAHEPVSARPDSAWYRSAMFLRRHRLGVAASGGVVLALGLGLGVAVHEGREAQHQRDQAESLIEFMLGDLRQKLAPVGRLDVLDAVGDKALSYYAGQDLARSDADSLGRRARALHLMGEIAEKRGQMAEAEQRFKQAADSTAELLARDPNNTQRIFDHGQSAYWMGYAAMRQGKTDEARQRFEAYLDLSKALVQREPQKAEWQTELAWSEHNLGVLLLRNQQAPLALSRFEAAKAIWQRLPAARPGLREEMAKTMGWLAEAQETLGQFDASIASHQAKLALLSQGDKNRDRRIQDLQATTQQALSRLQLSAGRGEAALAAAISARETFAGLQTLDPGNLNMLERLSFARLQLAEVAAALGQTELARRELAACGPALERLLAADAAKPAWALKLRGRWLAAQLPLAASPAALQRLRISTAQFLDQPLPGTAQLDSDSRWLLALTALRLGDAWAAEDPSQARARWRAALQDLTPLGVEAIDPRVTSLRAHALARLGRAQEARPLAEKLAASAYRHPEWQAGLGKLLADSPPR